MRAAVIIAVAGALAVGIACGGSSDGLPDDAEVPKIASVAEGAANGFRDGGAEIFRQWFSPEFHQRCSEGEFAKALKDTQVPAGFSRLASVHFAGSSADATVVLVSGSGKEYEEEWEFVQGEQEAWFLDGVPATKDCGR